MINEPTKFDKSQFDSLSIEANTPLRFMAKLDRADVALGAYKGTVDINNYNLDTQSQNPVLIYDRFGAQPNYEEGGIFDDETRRVD